MEVPLRRLYHQHHISILSFSPSSFFFSSLQAWLSIKIAASVLKSRMPDAGDGHSCIFLTFIGPYGNDPAQPCLLAILPGPLHFTESCPMSDEKKIKNEHISPFHHYLQVGELSSMALCPRNHFLSDL